MSECWHGCYYYEVSKSSVKDIEIALCKKTKEVLNGKSVIKCGHYVDKEAMEKLDFILCDGDIEYAQTNQELGI